MDRNVLTYVLIAALACVAAFQSSHQWKSVDEHGKPIVNIRDFAAFYCAGAAKDAGGDPYIAKDFIACGGRDGGRGPVRDAFDSPAPIPGYDVALFALVAKLRFLVAANLWLVLSLVATFGGAIALARCAELDPLFVSACFAIDGLVAFGWGQVTPVVLGALCLGALAAHRRQPVLAGVATLVTTIEPHVGLAAVLATALFLPRTRPTLAIGLTLLALVAFLAIGLHGNVTYFTKVTPLHVLAEVPMSNQYSLTWALHGLGIAPDTALRLGSVSYGVMLLVGLLLARPAARMAGSEAAIVLVPAAACVLGGPFIHDTQVALAMPALLLLAGRSRRSEIALWIGVGCLAVIWWIPQWQGTPNTPSRFESLLLAGLVAYVACRRFRADIAPAVGLATAAGYYAITFAIIHWPVDAWYAGGDAAAAYATRLGRDIAYASGRYGLTIREHPSVLAQYSTQLFITKIPFWIAPVLLVGTLASRLRRGSDGTRAARGFGRDAIVEPKA